MPSLNAYVDVRSLGLQTKYLPSVTQKPYSNANFHISQNNCQLLERMNVKKSTWWAALFLRCNNDKSDSMLHELFFISLWDCPNENLINYPISVPLLPREGINSSGTFIKGQCF